MEAEETVQLADTHHSNNGGWCEHSVRLTGDDLLEISEAALAKAKKGKLKCEECQVNYPNVWICLHPKCEGIYCGRKFDQHSIHHFQEKHHAVCFNISTNVIWCHACDDEVLPFGDREEEDTEETQLSGLSREQILTDWSSENILMLHSKQSGFGTTGLSNLGNTCYMNAALQALSNCLALTDYFIECKEYIKYRGHHRIVDSYLSVVNAVWSGKYKDISPSLFLQDVKALNPAFRGYAQHDSQEFLRFFLDRLHEKLKSPEGNKSDALKTTLANGVDKHPSENGTANGAPMKATPQKKKYRSIVSDIFAGNLQSCVTCSNCNQDSIAMDPFYDLSLPIDKSTNTVRAPVENDDNKESYWKQALNSAYNYALSYFKYNGLQLEDCLDSFFAPELLTGAESFYCEKCKKRNESTKTFRIAELPQVLCVQLKRFRYDYYFSSKISCAVTFPLENLDMRPYCIDPPSNTTYSLFGIVNHRGSTGGGHYVAYGNNPMDGQWYEFDDSYVTLKTASEVADVEAYILFYKRQSNLSEKIENLKMYVQPSASLEIAAEGSLVPISRLWVHKWKYSDSPGPVSNFDFLCDHGYVNCNIPAEADIKKLYYLVKNEFFQQLVSTYDSDHAPAAVFPLRRCQLCIERIKQEAQMLQERREFEAQRVRELDTKEIGEGEYWYLMEASWLGSWIKFKRDNGPLPDPISNHLLLEPDGIKPKSNLKPEQHFRGVNKNVWNFFMEQYGGGPTIVRSKIDIYLPPPPSPSPSS